MVLVSGPAETLELAKKLISEIDKPKNPGDKPITLPDPVIRKYAVSTGTADAIAKVLQADMPSIRVLALPLSNEIVAYATPDEHEALLKKIGFPDKKPNDK